jgi:hypothetical protein
MYSDSHVIATTGAIPAERRTMVFVAGAFIAVPVADTDTSGRHHD